MIQDIQNYYKVLKLMDCACAYALFESQLKNSKVKINGFGEITKDSK